MRRFAEASALRGNFWSISWRLRHIWSLLSKANAGFGRLWISRSSKLILALRKDWPSLAARALLFPANDSVRAASLINCASVSVISGGRPTRPTPRCCFSKKIMLWARRPCTNGLSSKLPKHAASMIFRFTCSNSLEQIWRNYVKMS